MIPKNYEIKAEDISYFKNQNKIITKGKTKAKIENIIKLILKMYYI